MAVNTKNLDIIWVAIEKVRVKCSLYTSCINMTNGGKTPVILHLGIGRSWIVCITLRPPYFKGRNPCYLANTRICGPKTQCEGYEEGIASCLCQESNHGPSNVIQALDPLKLSRRLLCSNSLFFAKVNGLREQLNGKWLHTERCSARLKYNRMYCWVSPPPGRQCR